MNATYQSSTMKFQVIEHKCKPLLSAETCEKLQLVQLNISGPESVYQVNESSVDHCLSKEELLSKYREVFSGLEHIGCEEVPVIRTLPSPKKASPTLTIQPVSQLQTWFSDALGRPFIMSGAS